MEEFFDSCGKLYDENIKLANKTVTMFNGNTFTASAPKEIIDMVSEKLDELAYEKNIAILQHCRWFHVKAYKNIFCLKVVLNPRYLYDTLYFIEDFDTLNVLCSNKKFDILDLVVDEQCSYARVNRFNCDQVEIVIKSTNIESLKIAIYKLSMNKKIDKYPTVNINIIKISTDNLLNNIHSTKCKEIIIKVFPETSQNLSIIAAHDNVIIDSPSDISQILAWWQVNNKYVKMRYRDFQTDITLPAFESVALLGQTNFYNTIINISNGTTILNFNTYCTTTGFLGQFPDSIREVELYDNNFDIPHFVETLKLEKLLYNKIKYQHIKKLQLRSWPDDDPNINLVDYVKEYFPKVTTLYMEKNMKTIQIDRS